MDYKPRVGDFVRVPYRPWVGEIVEIGITVVKLIPVGGGEHSWALIGDIEPHFLQVVRDATHTTQS
jgi:hypothetical protein